MHDESYIQIALELAKKGKGVVSPAPLTGSLIVKNNKIIGAAYKSCPNEEPAEIIAIKNSKESVEDSVLYTNLEPCGNYENEPDCADEIINSRIKKIVIGTANPNQNSGGAAIKKFKKAGIDVKLGILEKECIDVNKFYFKYVNGGLPYTALKMAVTVDGKIADDKNNSKWITSVESRSLVHELRSEYDAVMVGIKTVTADDPNLTVRLVEGRNPKRIVLDAKLQISTNSRLVKKNSDKNLIILTSKKNKDKKKKLEKLHNKDVEIVFVNEKKNGKLDLRSSMKKLGSLGITSVLVEGGGKVFSSLLKEKLDDELLIFVGPKILGSGIPLASGLGIKSLNNAVKYSIKDLDKIGEDALLRFVRR